MKIKIIQLLCVLVLFGCQKNDIDVFNGSDTNLAKLNGNWIVVNYWADWCAPCIKEMPGIKKAEEILEEYGYTFLLVSDETLDEISDFKNEWNFDFNFLKSTKSFETLGVYAMPTSYIFDENGKIVETIVGAVKWDSKEMIDKLKML